MTFRKSSYSQPNQDCVEVAHTVAAFGLRDSRLTSSPILTVTAEHGRVLVRAIKTGRFDH